jgi:steroid delta-isomerase-like uncharacterized protein
MSAQDNANLARSLYEGFNARDFDRAAASISEDSEILNVPLGVTLRGLEGNRQFQQGWATAFPDSKVEITNLIATDDYVVVEFTGRGTHTGPLAGPTGTIPATGRPLTLPFVDIHHIQNGKIVRSRTYYDVMGMMQQLGLVPPMGSVQSAPHTV